MILSYQQLRTEWLIAGGSPRDADTAAAVAEAESHGNNLAVNHADPYGGSHCAWQINGVHPFSPHALTHDPYLCALAAVYVRHKSGWGAWSTYHYGKYRAFMPHYHAHARHAHATRSHNHHARTAHHPRPAANPTPIQTIGFLGTCFVGAAGLLLAWNGFRAGCKLVEESVREEVAARKRYARRKKYQEDAAFKRRTMPRATRRTALA